MTKDNNSRVISHEPEVPHLQIRKNMARYRLMAIIILVLLSILYLLWSFRPKPAVECETTKEGLAIISEKKGHNVSLSFVDDQVIVTGPEPEVEQVLAGFNNLKVIRKCTLNYLSKPSGQQKPEQQYFPFPDSARTRLTTRLCQISNRQPVTETVEAINRAGRGRYVFADLNLLTGHPLGACGNPYSGGGSPFGGTPKLLPVGEEAAVKLFWEQWAFRQVGIGPALKDELAGAAVLHQGEGVLVGVFDTSPFLDPWDGAAQGASPIDMQETVKWVNPAMDVEPLALKVSYPRMVNIITATGGIMPTGSFADVRDHGLFVAGLVHAVAPASEIRLIRVLNEVGCGSLFTLNEALGSFTGEVKKERGTLKGVVINLSLGVHNPYLFSVGQDFSELDKGEVSARLREQFQGYGQALTPQALVEVKKAGNDWTIVGADKKYLIRNENRTLNVYGRPDKCDPQHPENDIVSLCTTLFEAHNEGAVIVAAAGNESQGDPLPAQIPAAYPFVIGVKASNYDHELACFSNDGQVSAPGGNGGPVGNSPCAPLIRNCSGDCVTGVIGPVLFPPKGSAYWPTHYGYWSGTSFSTPLVSGQAALLLQADVRSANVEGEIISNAKTFGNIQIIYIP